MNTPAPPAAASPSRHALRAKLVGGVSQGLISATAALLAYLPAKPLGLQEGFWGSITAIAVVQTELAATRNSARDQFAGAATGGLIGAAVVSILGESVPAYALAVVASMTACWVLNINTAARLAGITATIIALVPHSTTVARMMLSRVAEVGWGVAVAIGVVWSVDAAVGRMSGGSRSVKS